MTDEPKGQMLKGMTACELLQMLNAKLAATGLPLATLAGPESPNPEGKQTITAILSPLFNKRQQKPENDRG